MTPPKPRAEEPAAEETQTGEVGLTGPGGIGLRAKGYRLMDIAWVVLAAAVIYGAWELKAHAGDSAHQSAAIVKSINEANAAVVNSMKESNAATVKALQDMTTEQRKANATMREIACLSDPAVKNRTDAREFCRRMAGIDR